MRPGLTIVNYPRIHLEGLRNITKTLSQDSTTPDVNLKLGLSEFKAGMLTAFSVRYYEDMDYILLVQHRVQSWDFVSTVIDYGVP
jgi:hypothetical protein